VVQQAVENGGGNHLVAQDLNRPSAPRRLETPPNHVLAPPADPFPGAHRAHRAAIETEPAAIEPEPAAIEPEPAAIEPARIERIEPRPTAPPIGMIGAASLSALR
jgi:hypothetical protein